MHLARATVAVVVFFGSPPDFLDLIFAGTLDAVFMFAYAIGLFVSGALGDM